jgi:hypothetical protein
MLSREGPASLPKTLQSITWHDADDPVTMLAFLESLCNPNFLPALVYVPQIYACESLLYDDFPVQYRALEEAAERALEACKSRGLILANLDFSEGYEERILLGVSQDE